LGFGFRVQGSGFWVQGPGFRVQGSGFRVQGSGFRVQGLDFRGTVGFTEAADMQALGLGCRAWGSGIPP